LGQALLQCYKPALPVGAASAFIEIRAPPTALRLSGFFDADDSRQNSQDEKRKLHGGLLLALRCENAACPRFVSHKAAAHRGEYRQAAGVFAEAVISSVELIVQPDRNEAVSSGEAASHF